MGFGSSKPKADNAEAHHNVESSAILQEEIPSASNNHQIAHQNPQGLSAMTGTEQIGSSPRAAPHSLSPFAVPRDATHETLMPATHAVEDSNAGGGGSSAVRGRKVLVLIEDSTPSNASDRVAPSLSHFHLRQSPRLFAALPSEELSDRSLLRADEQTTSCGGERSVESTSLPQRFGDNDSSSVKRTTLHPRLSDGATDAFGGGGMFRQSSMRSFSRATSVNADMESIEEIMKSPYSLDSLVVVGSKREGPTAKGTNSTETTSSSTGSHRDDPIGANDDDADVADDLTRSMPLPPFKFSLAVFEELIRLPSDCDLGKLRSSHGGTLLVAAEERNLLWDVSGTVGTTSGRTNQSPYAKNDDWNSLSLPFRT